MVARDGDRRSARRIRRLPGVTSQIASTLLHYELARPVVPLCTPSLQEAKALGWVPGYAGAEAALLHLQARLPAGLALRRAASAALRRQHVFRLTQRTVSGVGAAPAEPEASAASAETEDEATGERPTRVE